MKRGVKIVKLEHFLESGEFDIESCDGCFIVKGTYWVENQTRKCMTHPPHNIHTYSCSQMNFKMFSNKVFCLFFFTICTSRRKDNLCVFANSYLNSSTKKVLDLTKRVCLDISKHFGLPSSQNMMGFRDKKKYLWHSYTKRFFTLNLEIHGFLISLWEFRQLKNTWFHSH